MIENHTAIKSLFENWTATIRPKSEDNFFSIGTRGFYENPFTEVLSFILKPENNYSKRVEFISLLLKSFVRDEVIESLITKSEIKKLFELII